MSASLEPTITARHAKVKEAPKGSRIPFFDNLKGILIILVVLGHFLSGATSAGILPA